MCKSGECLQITLHRETPCFQALNSTVCDLPHCVVSQFLATRNIKPKSQAKMDLYAIDHALHWVCPQSNLNPLLSKETQDQISEGLKASLNR